MENNFGWNAKTIRLGRTKSRITEIHYKQKLSFYYNAFFRKFRNPPSLYSEPGTLLHKTGKVFGVTLDNKINFATHLLNISKSTYKNFNALKRFRKYMTTD